MLLLGKVYWCVDARDWERGGGGGGGNLQHRLSAQRWAAGINMWPGAVLTLNHPLGVQIVFSGF